MKVRRRVLWPELSCFRKGNNIEMPDLDAGNFAPCGLGGASSSTMAPGGGGAGGCPSNCCYPGWDKICEAANDSDKVPVTIPITYSFIAAGTPMDRVVNPSSATSVTLQDHFGGPGPAPFRLKSPKLYGNGQLRFRGHSLDNDRFSKFRGRSSRSSGSSVNVPPYALPGGSNQGDLVLECRLWTGMEKPLLMRGRPILHV